MKFHDLGGGEGVFNLAKTIVSVLHREPKYKVEKLIQEVGDYAAEDQIQIWTSSWWINHPGSVHTKIDQYSLSFISEE